MGAPPIPGLGRICIEWVPTASVTHAVGLMQVRTILQLVVLGQVHPVVACLSDRVRR